MALGLCAQSPSYVFTDHEAGDTDVSTEVLIGDHHDPGIGSTGADHQRLDDGSAEGAGENADGSISAELITVAFSRAAEGSVIGG